MKDSLMILVIFSGIGALLGLIFLIIGIVMLKNKKKKEINCTSMTYGKVTDIVKHQTYNSDNNHYSTSWHPVFEYNVGELKFIKESPYGSSQSKYAIGQNIQVYFNPEDYNEYYIAGDNVQKTVAIIFIITGIIVTIVALLCAILMALIFTKV